MKINSTFRILSAIGIILVVAGHADFHVFDLGGLFPYYSFHVAVFLFISGYFYNEREELQILAYIKRKVLRLMVPYFIWNLFYGILAAILRMNEFQLGESVSIRSLFLDPFLGGHQFAYNFPAWFVPALFLIEVINICMRRILTLLRINYEYLIMAGCLAAGILTVWLAIDGHVWGYYKLPGRILFMLPLYELGHLYKKKLEKKDTLSNIVYFGIVLMVQLCVVLSSHGLAYSTVWCTGFANGPLVPYITALTGIAFWLRVSKMLSPLLTQMKWVNYLGAHTFAVMMHHILGIFVVKGAFYILSLSTSWFRDFDTLAYFTDVNYIYLVNGIHITKWIYLAAGLLVPLLISYLLAKSRQLMRNYIDSNKKIMLETKEQE